MLHQQGVAAPNAIYFVAERREPSGDANQKQREVPEGSRPAANKIHPRGVKKDGIVAAPANTLDKSDMNRTIFYGLQAAGTRYPGEFGAKGSSMASCPAVDYV